MNECLTKKRYVVRIGTLVTGEMSVDVGGC